VRALDLLALKRSASSLALFNLLGCILSDMRSRIFVSCGQRPAEKAAAKEISEMLETRGFYVYVAIDAQTILDINGGIIRELKSSDCYLFVNFCRDKIDGGYRGSLFSNQELAIAYALDFDRI
jgi:hypothetical protein